MKIGLFGLRGASLALLALAGCALVSPNPLDERRGAIVLVFDTRMCGDLRTLRGALSTNDVRATFFADGRIGRREASVLKDLRTEGHEIGLSGLKGIDPQSYCSMYGQQKYFQDEILTQVLDAERQNLNPRHYLLRYRTKMKSDTLKLPPFLVAKGFARVVDVMPDYVLPQPVSAPESAAPVVHAYQLNANNFDRAQVATLASRNQILVVEPDRQVLPELLDEARAQGVPFVTLRQLCRIGQ